MPDARVAIYSVNFGEASSHLEGARGLLGRADERVKSLGRTSDAMQIEAALSRIDDAQRMAGKLDQGANARAGEAAKTLARCLSAGLAQRPIADVWVAVSDASCKRILADRFSSSGTFPGNGLAAP